MGAACLLALGPGHARLPGLGALTLSPHPGDVGRGADRDPVPTAPLPEVCQGAVGLQLAGHAEHASTAWSNTTKLKQKFPLNFRIFFPSHFEVNTKHSLLFRELAAVLVLVRVSLTNPGRHRDKNYKDV